MADTSGYNITFVDRSKELSSVGVRLPAITAANHNTILDSVGNKLPAGLSAAIKACSLCEPYMESVALPGTTYAWNIPTSPYAQRELALRVSFQDTVNNSKGSFTIPGADWATLGQPNTDEVLQTAQEWIDLVTAVEAECVSMDGNPIAVISGRLVGRAS